MRRVSTTLECSARPGLLFGAALLSAACALSLAPARAGQSVPPRSSMLDGAVTYTLPPGWHISMYMNRPTHGSAEIHNTEKGADYPQARLFLSAHPLTKKKTVGEMGSDNYGSHMRKVMEGTVLSDKADSEEWRTVVSTLVQSGKPYLMLEHFGVVDNTYASATVVMPLGSGDVGRMKKVFEDFNAVCESLKVNGRGNFENRVSPDIIKEQLKVNAKK
jgi:hypothetical protein